MALLNSEGPLLKVPKVCMRDRIRARSHLLFSVVEKRWDKCVLVLSGSVRAKKKTEDLLKKRERKREQREKVGAIITTRLLKILHWGHLIEPFVIEASFHYTQRCQSKEMLYMWVEVYREHRVDDLPPRCLPTLIEKNVYTYMLYGLLFRLFRM